MPVDLPIDPILPRIVDAVRRGHVVLEAPTGAGKTTRVPPALLDAVEGEIVVLEPRRVAARAAATRMAEERGESVGQTVGFQVRFERKTSAATRIRVVTEGILLRQLVADPFLEGVGAIVLDEVHERGLDGDLVLAMARRVQREVRPELRIVAMSATLAVQPFAAFLDAPVVASEGRAWPVDVRYLTRPDDRRVEDQVADAVPPLLDEVDGDVLVFLPGVGEIRRCAAALAPRLSGVDVVPLHGRLPPAEQDAALRTGPRQRVVLATNVAETSVTIPGVRAVIDTGLVRMLRHDPGRGLDRLVTESCSRASADQRAGRAGRTAPGICLRLWTERQHAARGAHEVPEIHRVDLAGPVLALLAFGEPDVHAFPWFDAPPEHALEAALDLLRQLGALEDGRLTPQGEAMATLPVHPRLGRVLVEAHARGVVDAAAETVALLSERLPLTHEGRARHVSQSDLQDLREALDRGQAWGWRVTSRGGAHRVRRLAEQLARATRRALGREGPRGDEADVRRALVAGWPDRVARRRGDEDRVLMASGRGARLHPSSAVRGADWLVAVDVTDTDRAEAVVRLAAAIEPDWLHAPARVEVAWDPDRDRVVGARRRRVGAIVLEEQPGVEADPADVHAALAAAIVDHPDRVLPKGDRDLDRLLGRLRFLRRQRPDLDLPDVSPEGLVSLAVDLAHGRRSLAEVRGADWKGALLGRLAWAQRQALDELAPERLDVPSGSSIRLDYPDDGPPVLRVRMQELFGLADTPRVAGAPVLLHLLAPNMRPQQVTDDLAGFWARAWPEVRKDLRGRYPKHSWPEDPLTAPPMRGAKRRR